jgi:hypothetical protein
LSRPSFVVVIILTRLLVIAFGALLVTLLAHTLMGGSLAGIAALYKDPLQLFLSENFRLRLIIARWFAYNNFRTTDAAQDAACWSRQ